MSNTIFGDKNDLIQIHRTIIPASASTTPNEPLGGGMYVPAQFMDVRFDASVVGSTSAAFQIGKVTGSTPAASATPLLTANVVALSVDVPQQGTLIGSQSLQQLGVGDRLVLIKTGNWAGVVAGLTCVLKRT